MANPQIQQVVDSMWWKLVPWLLAATFIGTFAGLFVKWLERRAIRFGRERRQRREEAKRNGRRPEAAATELETPHCPECNSVMVKRKAKKGPKVGQWFWGCSRYPECRGTREV